MFNAQIHQSLRPILQKSQLNAYTFLIYAQKIEKIPEPMTQIDLEKVFNKASEDVILAVLALLCFHDLDEKGLHPLDSNAQNLIFRSLMYNKMVTTLAKQI